MAEHTFKRLGMYRSVCSCGEQLIIPATNRPGAELERAEKGHLAFIAWEEKQNKENDNA